MNRQKFLKSLNGLSAWRETAFILGLAERNLPNLQLYLGAASIDMDEESKQAVCSGELLERSWKATILVPDEEELVEMLDVMDSIRAQLADDENYGAQPSMDCCNIWEQALLSVLNQDKKRALECAQQALQSITHFIEFSEGQGLSENQLVKLFEKHPLIEREFSFQSELDELLRLAKKPSEFTIDAVRKLARDEGVSSLGISLD